MLTIAERLAAMEVRLLELVARNEAINREVTAAYSAFKTEPDSQVNSERLGAARKADRDFHFEWCAFLDKRTELQRVLATGTDPHPSISEGAL